MARKREERSPGKGANQQQAGAVGGAGGPNHGGNVSGSSSACGSVCSGGNKAPLTANSNSVSVFQSLKQQLATIGLAMREIPGDGNCLFGALADQMDGSRATHYKHRHEIVTYMRQHRLHFEPFVEDDVSFHDHLRRLSEAGTFGGNECIVAFARLHSVMVVIHQLNTALWTISGLDESDCSEASLNMSEVHISFHNGDHYNSVRGAGDCSLAPASIRLAVVDGNSGWQAPGNRKLQQNSGSGSGSRRDLGDMHNKLMQYTGCEDPHVARQFLDEHNYELNEAMEALIAYMLENKQHKEEEEDVDSDDSGQQLPNLWSTDGTGSRILGEEAAAIAGSGPHHPGGAVGHHRVAGQLQAKINQANISNAKRKDLKKQLRKQQNITRKKQQQQQQQQGGGDNAGYDYEDSAADARLVNDIACLSI